MLFLASMKEIPSQPLELLTLVDHLFDAKKMHQELLGKIEQIGGILGDSERGMTLVTPLKQEQESQREMMIQECPTTDAKEFKMNLPKTTESLSSNVSLFSTFNQG